MTIILPDLEKLREFLAKFHAEQDFINSVIDSQSMGILFLRISGFKEETLPIPTRLLEIVEETCPRFVFSISINTEMIDTNLFITVYLSLFIYHSLELNSLGLK
jgi:hypothetical protein